jgi:nucleotide-binding universal stress UspA family protein
MFGRILLPLDGSEVAEMAIPYAKEFAGRLGSEIVLYHVHEQGHQQQEHMDQIYLNTLVETIRRDIGKIESSGAEVKVTTKVELGEPAENICNLVNKNKVDLIIMTAVSISGLKIGKMLGSVTDHVCRTVPSPVMLIRPKGFHPPEGDRTLITKILIPLDGSDLSKLAIPVGEKLATALKVPITLFEMANMIRPYVTFGGYGTIIDYSKWDAEEKKRSDEEMSALTEELKLAGVDATSVVTSGFDAAYEIEKVSKKIGTDLVIMSTNGRSGFERWILGSVAERVLRYGEIPLILINARAG